MVCEKLDEEDSYIDAACTDRGSKAQKPFKEFKFKKNPDVSAIINHDDWHDLTKLETFLRDHLKGVDNFVDKPILMR